MTTNDTLIWRDELQRIMGVHSTTLRRWQLSGALPNPDVQPSRQRMAWKLSTLQAAGYNLPDSMIPQRAPFRAQA